MCPVRCKDYIQDLIWKENTDGDEKMQIYGFEYTRGDYKEYQTDDTLYLVLNAVSTQNPKFPKEWIKNLDLTLINFCKPLGYTECDIYQTEDEKTLVISFSREITKAPYIFSLFVGLCRVGTTFEDGDILKGIKTMKTRKMIDFTIGDVGYYTAAYPLIEYTLTTGKIAEQSWKDYKTVNSCHNSSGLYGFYSNKFRKSQTSSAKQSV